MTRSKPSLKLVRDAHAEIMVRPLDPTRDVHFILNTWLKSYNTSDFARGIPASIYFNHHKNLILSILLHKHTGVSIVCSKDDTSHIVGYSVYNTAAPIVHYIYMKQAWRRLGIGSKLLEGIRAYFGGPETVLSCSHKRYPKRTDFIRKRLVYNPYVLNVPESEEEPTNGSDSET